MIKLSNITKVFHQGTRTIQALNNVSLHVPAGQIYGVIGASGAGKSTLIRCVNLLERPTEGSVLVDGQELTTLSESELTKARRQIGMIFQHHPQGSVEEFRQVCDCRKPHPGMFLSARDYLHIDMAASYMVGDKLEDMQAAAAASVGTKVLVRTGKPITPEAENAADWVLNSLADLPQAIKKQQKPA